MFIYSYYMPKRVSPRLVGLAIVALLGSLAACGGSGDRSRNVETIAGQACQTLGETKTVSKVVNVCGRSGDDLVWYAAVSRKPKGEKCTRPGGFRTAAGKILICAVIKKQRMWIEVAPLPTIAFGSTAPQPNEAGESSNSSSLSTTSVPIGSDGGASASSVPSVGSAFATSPPTTVIAPQSEVKKVSAASLPATKLIVISAPKEIANDQESATPLVVQVATEASEAKSIAGITVSVVPTRGDVVAANQTAVTDGQGRARFDRLKLRGPVQPTDQVSLEISAPDLQPTGVNLTLQTGEPSRVVVVSHGTTAVAGQAFADPVKVVLIDSGMSQVTRAGVTVTATDDATNKVLGTADTGEDGSALFDSLVLTKAGDSSVTYSAVGMTPDKTRITVLPATAAGVKVVSADLSQLNSGVPAVEKPVVMLVDRYGNAVNRANVVVTATIADATVGDKAVVSGGRANTDASGRATFEALSLAGTAGTYALEFGIGNGTFADSTTVKLVAGLATAIQLNTSPTLARSGITMAVPFSAKLLDAWGNLITDTSATISVSVETSTGGRASLANALAHIGANGIASFDDLVITGDPGKVTLQFASGGQVKTSADMELRAGYVTRWVFLAHQESVVAGEDFDTPTKMLMMDDDGHVAKNSPVQVWGKCGSDPFMTRVFSDENGVATFSAFNVTNSGTTYCSYAAVNEVGVTTPLLTRMLTVVPRDGRRLAIVEQPSAKATNGIRFDSQPSLTIRDAQGGIPPKGVKVTAKIVEQPGVLARLDNATATSDSTGLVVFDNLSITGTAGRYVLSFDVDRGIGAKSSAVLVQAGPAVDFVIVREAGMIMNGAPFGFPPIIQLIDSGGNPATGNFTLRMTNPGATTMTATPNAQGIFTPGLKNGYGVNIHGKAGMVTPTYSLFEPSGQIVSEKTGAAFTLRPGHFESADVRIPAEVASGTRIPEFNLYDEDGNIIDEGALIGLWRRWKPLPGRVTWFSGQNAQTVESDGHVSFGNGAFINGSKGSEVTVNVMRYVDGDNWDEVGSFDVTITSDAKPGDFGPSGGRIVYVFQDPMPGAPGISDGGRFLEVAPSGWEPTLPPHPLGKFDGSDFATSAHAGDGPKNTAALVARLNDPQSAASIAASAVIWYNDGWFLPSIVELMAANRYVRNIWRPEELPAVTKSTEFWSSTVSLVAGKIATQRLRADTAQSTTQTYDKGRTIEGPDYTLRPMRYFG